MNENTNQRLFIVDGNSILYREFFALPNLINRHGEYTGALFGFAKTMVEIVTKFKPSHLAVAFDAGKITFRNSIYDGYKATRKPMPEELRSQLAPVREMLSAMNIKYIEEPGIEGDDVIGSLVGKFNDIKKVIVTGDRDSYQLIDENTEVYLNKKGLSDIKVLDEQAIQEMFGLTPKQMVFVKAIQGDTSDNIPGVKGIGEKGALKLISLYGSLDGVYQNIDKISGATRNYLVEDREKAYMSLDLARIKTDADLGIDIEDLEVKFPFTMEVRKIFERNDFKSLLKREELFLKIDEAISPERPANKVDVLSLSSIDEFLNEIEDFQEIGLYFFEDSVHASNGIKEVVLSYAPLLGVDETNIRKALKNIIQNKNILKIFFDSKHERHEFEKVGVVVENFFDSMIAKHLVMGEGVTTIEHFLDYPDSEKMMIASILVSSRGELVENLQRMGMKKLYDEVELPLSGVLKCMENRGFKIDLNRLQELDKKYDAELEVLTKQIHELVGRDFNINSPKQLGEIIYDELQLKKSKKKSTASEVLEEIADRHPLIPLVIRYRKVAKFSSGFIKNMYSHLDDRGYIHTNFNQTLTSTGRLSSSDPNLQNIPIRGEESREIRSMFVAESEDRVLIDVDYSQIELRVLAHMTGDELLIKAFNEDLDIHTQTAMEVFGLPEQMITPEMRRRAKVINFGIVYGISDFGLADDLNTSVPEAKQYITNFFNAHPKIREFMDESVRIAKETGRATTILGRTRNMREISSSNYQVRMRAERATYNMPVQGSASDIIKLAMIKVENELKKSGLDAKLIMQVHDELIIDSAKKDAEKVKQIVEKCMQQALPLDVKLDTDGSLSYRWSDGH